MKCVCKLGATWYKSPCKIWGGAAMYVKALYKMGWRDWEQLSIHQGGIYSLWGCFVKTSSKQASS